ncbi:unnamed protein product [Rotaria sordida]|uniref:Uncharacterized protein n=1 Tax=Rotaria sordida TaxID=392033 RepID=A0A815K7Z9_9BILA|nr:unnamed protein product [Rotaria sordida]CAF1473517.1 unnamed protein product [Rotaria sordida]CAF1485183.1 unnamed protein product [Rotaria sordida]CAF1628044.1 unnamed protein product [Rotaria sordida]CAF4002144.1 unnamed protein product [Rotaria sordida]
MNTSQMLPIDDYSMNKSSGRIYRYLSYNKAPLLFPFSNGLSYSKLIIFPNQISNVDTDIIANISIINEGPFPAQFIIQLYYEFSNSTVIELLMRELLKFTKITFLKKINKKLFHLPFVLEIFQIQIDNNYQVLFFFWIGNSCHRYAQTALIIDFDS